GGPPGALMSGAGARPDRSAAKPQLNPQERSVFGLNGWERSVPGLPPQSQTPILPLALPPAQVQPAGQSLSRVHGEPVVALLLWQPPSASALTSTAVEIRISSSSPAPIIKRTRRAPVKLQTDTG